MNRTGKEKTRESGRIFPGVIVVAFIASAITFFLLLHIEKSILSNYEKGTVWVASGDLQKSLEISSANLETCFVQIEVDKQQIPESVITDVNTLKGSRTVFTIPEGTILSASMFTNDESYENNMVQPIIAGCKADDLFQAVSGILRKGDFVNIYTVNDEMGETYLLWENVLVYQTFDNAGNMIAPEDTSTAAARMNLLIEEGYAEQFYTEINNGSLRMVKVWDF